jgi:phosphatidylglycerol:prolipoprotein diacylglycerol transferase
MYPILFGTHLVEIRSYAFFLAISYVAGLAVAEHEAKRIGIDTQEVRIFGITVIPVSIMLGFLNGRLFDIISAPKSGIETGLVSFGFVLGMLLGGWVFARVRKLPVVKILDLVSLLLPLVLGITRIGCILNGCCYGKETISVFSVFMPDLSGNWANRYPTQFLLLVFDFGVFYWLFRRSQKYTLEGKNTILFLMTFSIGRVLIDSFRDLPHFLWKLNLHQWVSLCLLLGVLIFLLKRSSIKLP